MIVVDASVAVKWVLPESDSALAEAILARRDPLMAPDLLQIEVASAISRRYRNSGMSPDQVAEIWAAWNDILRGGSVGLLRSSNLIDKAFGLSQELRHPLSDCVYLAAAQMFGASLVTADATFARRAVAAGHGQVTLLGAA